MGKAAGDIGSAVPSVVSTQLRLRPGDHAAVHPGKVAVVMADGSSPITYEELEHRSAALADHLHGMGLGHLDRVAIVLENRPEFLVVALAAQRSGLAYVPVNWHLSIDEAAYIVHDSGATVLFTSSRLLPLAEEASKASPRVTRRIIVDGRAPGWAALDDLLATTAHDRAPDVEGQWMFYSSGTTGRPKGIIRRPPEPRPFGTGTAIDPLLGSEYGFSEQTVYLSPAPLYHAAPLGWSLGTLRRGGTVVLLDRFEPVAALESIERHRVTHGQFVPTMFVRMLKLPAELRASFDVSSLKVVVHSATPCPVEIKEEMLRWWGPVIHEYYGGSEGTGFVSIGPEEWLAHPGSVGRSRRGPIHVVGDDGRELPAGEPGVVWFEGAAPFEYHGDPEKTAEAFDDRGWTTLGDVGYLDAEGYLYLTDRATDLIITGGVNVYPQEVERVLLLHDAVLDAGVIGTPDPEFGEQVVAFVQLSDGWEPSDHLRRELFDYAAGRLASFKRPRHLSFSDELPRLPTGKLLRRRLREQLAQAETGSGEHG